MKSVVKKKKNVRRRTSTVRKEPELAIQIEIIEMLKKELNTLYYEESTKNFIVLLKAVTMH